MGREGDKHHVTSLDDVDVVISIYNSAPKLVTMVDEFLKDTKHGIIAIRDEAHHFDTCQPLKGAEDDVAKYRHAVNHICKRSKYLPP